jgi:hypothetical protein
MGGPGLNTNIDTTYPDSGTDPSVKVHQQIHDILAAFVNMLDETMLTGGSTGDVLTKLAGGTYGPAAPTGGGGGGGPINLDVLVRAAFLATTSTTEHATTVYQKGTSGNDISALNVVSDNPSGSAVQISGTESARGTVKITHRKPGAADANAAALSIDLQDGAGNGNSAAQGIFITGTEGATTGNLITARNNGRDDFVIKGTGRVGVGVATGATPAGQVEVVQPDTTTVGLAMTAIASGLQMLLLKDSGGNARFEVNAAGNAIMRALAFFTSSIQVGSSTSDVGGGAGVISIKDATTVPTTNPTGGGILYVESGALKFRDTGGTVTTLTKVGGGGSVANAWSGARTTLIWDDAQSRWEDTAGTEVTARPGGRNDVLLDLIGGEAADAPAWANQPGDIHYPTA